MLKGRADLPPCLYRVNREFYSTLKMGMFASIKAYLISTCQLIIGLLILLLSFSLYQVETQSQIRKSYLFFYKVGTKEPLIIMYLLYLGKVSKSPVIKGGFHL